MATLYGRNAGGNWNTAATWSTTAAKDASRTAAAAAPTNADDVILDDYSGSITVNQTTCVAKSLNCTVNGNYAGTLTFTAGQVLIVGSIANGGGSVTLKGTYAGTGALKIISSSGSTAVLTSNTVIISGSLTIYSSTSAPFTLTIADNAEVDGQVSINIGTSGAITINSSQITANDGIIFTSTNATSTGSTKFVVAGGTLDWNNFANGRPGFCWDTDLAGDITVTDWSTGGGKTLTYISGTITWNGDLSVMAGGATIDMGDPTGTYTTPLNIRNNGTQTLTLTHDLYLTGYYNAYNGTTTTIAGSNLYATGFRTAGSGGSTGIINTSTNSKKLILTGGSWSNLANCVGDMDIAGDVTVTNGDNVAYSGGTLTYVSGTVTTTGSTLSIVASCTLNTPTANMSWYNLACTGTATLTLTSNIYLNGTLSNAGVGTVLTLATSDITANGLYTATHVNTRIVGSGRTITLAGGTWSRGASLGYIACNLTFAGNVIISGDVQFGSTDVAYTATLLYSSGTLTTTSSTVAVGVTTGGKTINFPSDVHLNNLAISGNGSNTLTLTNDLYLDGYVASTGGSTAIAIETSDIYANGLSISGTYGLTGRTIHLTGGTWSNSGAGLVTSTISFEGDVIVSGAVNYRGTINYVSGTITTTGSTLNILSTSTLNTPAANMSWNNITCTVSSTLTLSSAITLTGILTSNAGATLTLATSNITCVGIDTTTTGIIAGSGRKVTITGGTWTATGWTTGYVSCNVDLAGNVTIGTNIGYRTGTLAYVSGTITTTSSILNMLNDNMTLSTNGMTWNAIATTAANSKTLTLGSALQAASINLTGTTTHTILACGTNNVTLTGNWTNPKGTTGRTGNNTFIFNGTSVLDGNTNFYNMTINAGKTVTFDDADTFTVTNNFNALGTAGSHVIMNTDNPGTTVDFDVTGTVQTVTYVDATDIDSAGGDAITTTGGSITRTVNWSLVNPPSTGNFTGNLPINLFYNEF